MEPGPDTKLSETQNPELVEAGVLQPWTVGELPPAPKGGFAFLKKAIGPGMMMAGASLGAGEWLFGPAVSAQYGAALLWLASLSIVGQLFVNLEVMRYALYTGEPVFVGFFRTRPGPRLWIVLYLILSSYLIWPYMASNAAVPLAAAVLGHLPGDATITILGLTISESVLVKILGYCVFLGAFVPLIFGGTVYRMLEWILTAKVVIILGFFIIIAVLMVPGNIAWEVTQGFFRFGTVPQRADTIIVGPHFTWTEYEGPSVSTVRGTLENGRPLVTSFIVRTGEDEQRFAMGESIPLDLQPQYQRMVAAALARVERGGFFVRHRQEQSILVVEGDVDSDGSWRPAAFSARAGDRVSSWRRLEEIPEPLASTFTELVRNHGVKHQNLFRYLFAHGQLPDLDWALLAAFVSIAGAGGFANSLLSNYARDKGWGMGARMGAIPSAVGGGRVTLSHVGQVFPLHQANLVRWRGWIRHIVRDQAGIWMICSFLGMALPCMVSLRFIRHAPVVGDRVAAMIAGAMTQQYADYGQLLWVITLFCGFVVLGPGQLFAADMIARLWTDLTWVSSKRAQRLQGNQVKYIYYGILTVYGLWGLSSLAFLDPLQIAKVGAGLGNVALAFTAFHTFYVNRVLLPPPVRSHWIVQLGLLSAGLFFLGISAIVVARV